MVSLLLPGSGPDLDPDLTVVDDEPVVVSDPPPKKKFWRRHRWLRRILFTILAIVLLLSPLEWSYGRALTGAHNGGWTVASVEWLREHGAGSLVDRVEVWYYTRHAPPKTGRPTHLPPVGASSVTGAVHQAQLPPRLAPIVSRPLAGENRWVIGPLDRVRRPALYTTWFRIDPHHPTLVVAAAWMDQHSLAMHVGAGTAQPGGKGWSWPGQVPLADRPRLIAAFNSGFRLTESIGGWYADRRLVRPLVDGTASLVIDDHGVANIGQWGTEVHMTPHVVAVRQNLHLIVDHGHAVSGMLHNTAGLWGSRKSQLEYTWRSGLGIDAAGHLIYVAGDKITLVQLADALVHLGAVRAMQLDIHDGQVGYTVFDPTGKKPPTKLLPTMIPPANRYTHPNRRDFLGVTLR